MTYAQGGLIEAVDYNTLISTVTGFNKLWGTGYGNIGYGQTPLLTDVSIDSKVEAANWADFYNKTVLLAGHQKTSIPTTYTLPAVGNTVSYSSTLGSTNPQVNLLTRLNNNTGNAVSSGSLTTTQVVYSTNYSTYAQFQFLIDFENADKARYFFNAGGLISFSFMHPAISYGINKLFNNLATDCGTIFFNQTSTANKVIANTTYTGVTKIGGGGQTPTINKYGYYQLPTILTEIFKQRAGPITYPQTPLASSYLNIRAKTNGPTLGNGDNGESLEFRVKFEISPLGAAIATGGTTVTCDVLYPTNSYISASWGTVSVAGTTIL